MTQLNSTCVVEQFDPSLSVKIFNASLPYADFLSEFDSVTKLPLPGSVSKATVMHYIETTGPPVYARPRRLSADKLEAALAEFEYLMKAGICRPSKSNWTSPFNMIKKSVNTWKPCGDFRALNSITTPDRYTLACLQDFTNILRGKKIFQRLISKRRFIKCPSIPVIFRRHLSDFSNFLTRLLDCAMRPKQFNVLSMKC